MNNYKLELMYDGGRYDGWQRMGGDSTENTVSAKLLEVVKRMTGEEVELNCGCRTEKGVHAKCQVANMKMNTPVQALELKNYLNRYLPRDIAVSSVVACDERFHAQLNAKSKTYMYRLDTGRVADVFLRRYAYHTFVKPDVDAMREAAKLFVGEHDYKLFTTAKKAKSTVKRVSAVDITAEGDSVYIRITANDFMHNMARFMIGMLLDVGTGLKKPSDIAKALEADASVTMSLPAEAYGLYLERVGYESDIIL